MSLPVGTFSLSFLPVAGTFAPAFAAYFVLLNLRVSLVRQSANTYIGDEVQQNAASGSKPGPDTTKPDLDQSKTLLIASRSHGNFVENVPFALLVASVAEANGAGRGTLIGAHALLFFFRVAHVEYGIRAKDSLGWGRPVGYFGTLIWIASMSAYAAWLAGPRSILAF
ncbi:hypothetical protein LTR84_007160 [Exophiala bonariae]|uniref:MAPEG family protein n=1 Tax=Exophiala bonariae TaxID=1690606 RepID=A0AAV9N0T2_9EURO|nr:hypothetical protein LTR84_007160 [Exophiala bonariae]